MGLMRPGIVALRFTWFGLMVAGFAVLAAQWVPFGVGFVGLFALAILGTLLIFLVEASVRRGERRRWRATCQGLGLRSAPPHTAERKRMTFQEGFRMFQEASRGGTSEFRLATEFHMGPPGTFGLRPYVEVHAGRLGGADVRAGLNLQRRSRHVLESYYRFDVEMPRVGEGFVGILSPPLGRAPDPSRHAVTGDVAFDSQVRAHTTHPDILRRALTAGLRANVVRLIRESRIVLASGRASWERPGPPPDLEEARLVLATLRDLGREVSGALAPGISAGAITGLIS